MPLMRIRVALVLGSLCALLPAPGRADVVYLANGRSFEGVLAEETGSQVSIRMPGGELKLPKSQVARVEKGESSYAEYLRRKEGLRRGAGAGEWLALAQWAKSRGLLHGAREAALKAAEIDPGLAGLGPILRGAGYAFDEELDRWIPYADAMRRRGFVQVGGQWLSREEMAERQRAREDEAQRRAVRDAADAAAAASRAQRALVELALYRETVRESEPAPAYYPPPLAVFPGYFPGVVLPPSGHDRPHHPRPDRPNGPHHRGGDHHRSGKDLGYGQFVGRQPGSLFPLEPQRSSSRP